jgi:hypothetical protein
LEVMSDYRKRTSQTAIPHEERRSKTDRDWLNGIR